MPYDVALICKNGHVKNSYFHEHSEKNSAFCPSCGSPTIHCCPNCNKDIKGHDLSEFGYMYNYEVPAFCEYCGSPFPWTESALQNAYLLIQEEEELSEQQKDSIIKSLPDIISETPRTNLAVVRVKKGIASAGKFTAEAIRQFVIDFGCELAIKSLGL